MKVLHISNKPIYPILDGGCVAISHFLTCLLSAGYDVKHLTISTDKHPFNIDEYPSTLCSIIRPESSFVNTAINPFSALAYIFKKGSYNIDRFNNKRFRSLIKKYLKEQQVDFVVFESIYLANYFSTIREYSNAKIIIRSHNVEYLIWERLANSQSSFLKKLYFKKLSSDLKKVELKTLQKIDGIACISDNDALIFKASGVKTLIETIPVSILNQIKTADYSVNTFFHFGAMNWLPNLESVRWLVNSIFPKIREKDLNAKLILAGNFMPEEFKTDASKGIEVIGSIGLKDDFFTSNGIMLTPLISGSGVRIKILEAMSFGVPIVTSEIGIEGINAQNNRDILIAKNEDEFISYAIDLSKSIKMREYIGTNAKNTIENNYQTDPIAKKIIEFFNKIS